MTEKCMAKKFYEFSFLLGSISSMIASPMFLSVIFLALLFVEACVTFAPSLLLF